MVCSRILISRISPLVLIVKLTAKVRKSKANMCTYLLELIHTDIYGPFVPPAMGGFRHLY